MTCRLALGFDDLHFLDPRRGYVGKEFDVLAIIDRYIAICPAIKLTMFAIPALRGVEIWKHPLWCARAKRLIAQGNVRLAVHGYDHSANEFVTTYTDARDRLRLAEDTLERAGLAYSRLFRAPYWQLSDDAIAALETGRWIVCPNSRAPRIKTRSPTLYWTWNLSEDAPAPSGTVVGHGHTTDACGNGMAQVIDRVARFVERYRPEFSFMDEVMG